MKKIKVGRQQRSMTLERAALGADTREIEFSFSSEFPADRWFGKEILSHAPGAANLSRLNDGGQLLFNHSWDDYIGVIEKAEIRSDKRGYVKVRFANHERAQQIMKDVEDGILRNVSFGYMIDDMKLTKSDNEKGDEFTATRWTPYEVSLVTVPADPTIGVGRAGDEGETREFEFETEQAGKVPAKEGERSMPPVDEVKPVDVKVVQSEAVRAERERISAITAICEKHGQGELARQMIEGGKSVDECRTAILEKMGTAQKPVTQREAEIGLNDKEKRQFSFVRALNALANPNDRKAWEAAGFEREVSDAAQKLTGRSAKGILVPFDVLRSQRDLVVGTPTAGGNLVATDLLSGSFIELLRRRAVLARAGMQTLSGLVGDISIPRQTGAATAYWIGENANITSESQQSIDQVRLTPKTVGAYTDYSRKLLLQSSIDVENMVRNDLAAVLALEIDRVGLYGSGSGSQPSGINTAGGLNTVNFAADAPTYAEIVGMESEVAADNADVGTMAYLVNARGRGVLKTTEKASSTGQFIWEAGNTVNGYRAEVSNQIASASAAHDYWFGNFADLIMGMWSGLDLTVDPYTGALAGTTRIIAMQDLDFAIRHPESFCKGANNP
jgi:HK97 family phage major capsid protein/HK97 family phage prohead protease